MSGGEILGDESGSHQNADPNGPPRALPLGGTTDEDDWSPTPDPAAAARIVERCTAPRAEIAGARVLGHRVGLRPVRDSVRLEREVLPDERLLVHNCGHGGAGVTVAWGCAREAAGLACR